MAPQSTEDPGIGARRGLRSDGFQLPEDSKDNQSMLPRLRDPFSYATTGGACRGRYIAGRWGEDASVSGCVWDYV